MLHCSCVGNMRQNSSFQPLMDLISWNSLMGTSNMRLISRNCQHFGANLNKQIWSDTVITSSRVIQSGTAIGRKDIALPTRDDFVQPACPLPERMPTKVELLRRYLEIERKKNLDQGSNYQAELGQCRYFLKIEEDKVKNERKERELLLEDFKSLGFKNKRLEDEMKGRKGNPDKRKIGRASCRERV